MFAVPRFAALAAFFVIALSIRTAAADPITVMWDANPAQDDVLGYRVIVAGETGTIGEFDVGNQTFFVFPGAIAGQPYLFSVAAYNVNGISDYALVAGFSDAPPSLADPGDQAALVGEPVVLQLDGFDIYGDPVTYAATGLPPGLTLEESTGLINGTATTVGTYTVTASVTDGLLTTGLPFTWYVDGEAPTVAITSPTTEPVYPTNLLSVDLGGTISDDVGVASVTWSNSRGGAGFATLTSATTWTIPELPLKSGDNDITVTAWDVGNRTATTTIAVVLSGVSVPTVHISNPTSEPTHMTSNPTIVMAGTATDSVGVTSMLWTSDRGGSGSVGFVSPPGAGFSIWNVPVMPLLPGVNVITVSAYNATEAEGMAVLTVTLNRAPVVTNPGSMNSLRRVGVMVPIAASDADGNQLTWSATDLPPGLDINPASGVVSGAPTTIGTFSTVVTVFDGIASGTASFTWTVSPVTVTPIVTAADKAYDGTTTATLTSCTLAGVLAGDSIACTGTAAFDTATAGAARPVTVSELTLTGPDAGYYVLASTIAGTTAAITPLTVTLIAPTGTIDTAVPSFTWTAVSGATQYELWVNDANDEARITAVYSAAVAGCGAGTGTCTVSPGVTLAPGLASWWIRASNGAGSGSWGSGFTFTVPTPPDTTAPAVALTTPTTAGTYATTSGTLAFGGTASDNVAVTQVSWATDRGTSGVAIGTSAWTIAAMPLTAGTTVLTVTARDAANNTATATLTITYTPAPPGAVTLLSPTGTIATATPSFSWTAVSDATAYQLWVNDASVGAKINTTYPVAAVGCGAGTGTCTVSPGVTLAPGVAIWWIRPSNGAGAGSWGSGVTFTVPAAPDTTAPTAALTTPTSTGTYTATTTMLAVSGTASDNVGVTQVSWTTNGGASGMATGTTTWSIAAVPLGVGTTILTVTARDAANNTASAMLTVTYDSLSPPGAATLLTPTGTSATATPTFSWTGVNGATHYQLWVNDANQQARINETYTAAAAGCSGGTGTCAVSPGVNVAPGAALWWIRASNAAGVGHWSAGLAFTVPAAADIMIPTIALTTPTSASTYTATSSTLTVGGTANDNVGVTQVSWTTDRGGSGVATGTTAWSIAAVPLAPGATVITVTARDAANNTTTATLTVTFNVPPAAATLVTPSGEIATATPSFSWAAVTGATHYQLWVNDTSQEARINTTYTAAAAGCGAGTGTCAVSPAATLAPGAALWWIRVSNAGTAGPWSQSLAFVVPAAADTTAPIIAVTSPTSAGTYTALSASIAVGGAASDNKTVTQVSWTTDRGASGVAAGTAAWSTGVVPLGAGATVITVTARDAANNMATATLTVTYNPPPPAAAPLVAPTGTTATATPGFTWGAVSGATHYQLWVNDSSQQARINMTYTAAAAGCSSGTGTCTVSPGVALAPGAVLWWIRTSNAAGAGPWSPGLFFTVPAP